MRVTCAFLLACVAGCATDHSSGPPIDASTLGFDAPVRMPDAHFVDEPAAADVSFVPPDRFVPNDSFTQTPDASTAMHAGFVTVGQGRQDSTDVPPYLEAGFYGGLSPALLQRHIYDPACRVVDQSASCVAISCTSYSNSDQAGALHATVGTTALDAPAPTMQAGTPSYSFYFTYGSGSLVADGTPITMTGSGATVPSFSQMLTMPGAPGTMLPTVVSRSADFVVVWGTTTADQIWVGIGSDATTAPYIECSAPVSAGQIVVPHAMLAAAFPVGTIVYPYGAAVNARDVAVGDYLVEFSAWHYVQGTVTVQP